VFSFCDDGGARIDGDREATAAGAAHRMDAARPGAARAPLRRGCEHSQLRDAAGTRDERLANGGWRASIES